MRFVFVNNSNFTYITQMLKMSIAFICIYLYDNKMRVISTVKHGYEYI